MFEEVLMWLVVFRKASSSVMKCEALTIFYEKLSLKLYVKFVFKSLRGVLIISL